MRGRQLRVARRYPLANEPSPAGATSCFVEVAGEQIVVTPSAGRPSHHRRPRGAPFAQATAATEIYGPQGGTRQGFHHEGHEGHEGGAGPEGWPLRRRGGRLGAALKAISPQRHRGHREPHRKASLRLRFHPFGRSHASSPRNGFFPPILRKFDSNGSWARSPSRPTQPRERRNATSLAVLCALCLEFDSTHREGVGFC